MHWQELNPMENPKQHHQLCKIVDQKWKMTHTMLKENLFLRKFYQFFGLYLLWETVQWFKYQ